MSHRQTITAGLLALAASLGPVNGAHAQSPTPSSSPDRVLRGWAHAIEQRDWRAVRGLWGNHGADSGLSPRAFALRWSRLRHLHVRVEPGQEEGAAGSLYYTAIVTLMDGKHRWSGPVVLRRVNDVDGATPEQLRWHFDRSVRPSWIMPG